MFRPQLPPIPFILLILLAIFSLPASAATFTVTNLDDSGPGSLRQAVLDANTTLGADTIAFQAGLTGAITLTSGEIQITDTLTLNGPGASVLAISGNKASRIFYATSLMSGKVLTINQLTLKSGQGGDGGIILSAGSRLTVNHCILSDSKGGSGGAIYAGGGTVTVNNSTFSGNSAAVGGGLEASDTAQTVVNDSTFISNSASDYGGGIVARRGNLTVNNSTLAYNSAVHWGGGIANWDSTVTVNNSTVFGNSATGGGGIGTGYYGKTSVNNSTVSGNSATNGGGMSLSERGASYIVTLANSIVAGNSAATGKEIYRTPEATGPVTSLGHNLFGENGADGLVNVTRAETDFVLAGAIDTALGELADNGGPTQTLLPVAGSPAINAGDNALIPEGITTDQRGDGYPRIVGSTVDIGAVEFGSGGGVITYPLTVSKTGGNGGVTSNPTGINCGATCTAPFTSGVAVTLTAAPDSGYSFSGWSGDCGGASTTCTVTLNAAKSVTALFANVPPSGYTVTASAGANGTISPATQTVNRGATTTFTVTPKAHYLATVAGCGGTLDGNTYTTGLINTDCAVVATFSPTVAATAPTITTPVLPDAVAGIPYATVLTAISGQYPYTYAATDLPPGLRLTPEGVLSGTPTTGGAFAVTATVTDALGRTGSRGYALTVSAGLSLVTAHLPIALVQVPYTQQLAAVGGQPPHLFTAAGLPAGLSLTPGGLLSGTPMESAVAAVELTVTDAAGQRAQQATTLTVRDFTFSQPNPEQPDQTIRGVADTCASAAVTTRTLKLGDDDAPTTGPDGVSLPYGLLEITVTGCQPGQTVLALTTVYPEPLPPGTQYWKYGRTRANPEPHWYVLPGAIIQGNAITLVIVDGDIGDSDLDVDGNLLDPGGPGVTGNTIDGAVPAVLPISEPYRAEFQALCDQGRCPANSAYDWSLAAGALPNGLTLTGNGATATLTGTPTQAGRYPFTVQALARGDSPIPTQQSYTLIITTPEATTLITHYYVSILEREPEAEGLAYWQGLIADRQAQGIDVKPVFRDMANFFFNSPEYLGRNTTDRQFITNLYLTFFQREPDEGGYAFWLEQLASGMARNTAMAGFLYSPEFTDFMLGLGF